MKIDNIKCATKFIDRLFGLMFKEEITPICFPKCHSIHTFFMKKNIDVVMTDRDNKIIAIYRNVPKNKIIINRKAYNTYELPTDKYKIKLNDKII